MSASDDEPSSNDDNVEHLRISEVPEDPYTKESIGSLGPPNKPETIPELKKERSRFWLVLFLACTILVILIIPFVMLLLGIELTEKHWEYLHIAFPALLGVFGSAATFYFERR